MKKFIGFLVASLMILQSVAFAFDFDTVNVSGTLQAREGSSDGEYSVTLTTAEKAVDYKATLDLTNARDEYKKDYELAVGQLGEAVKTGPVSGNVTVTLNFQSGMTVPTTLTSAAGLDGFTATDLYDAAKAKRTVATNSDGSTTVTITVPVKDGVTAEQLNEQSATYLADLTLVVEDVEVASKGTYKVSGNAEANISIGVSGHKGNIKVVSSEIAIDVEITGSAAIIEDKNGEKHFGTLQDAVDAVKKGGTIELVDDLTDTEITVQGETSFTIKHGKYASAADIKKIIKAESGYDIEVKENSDGTVTVTTKKVSTSTGGGGLRRPSASASPTPSATTEPTGEPTDEPTSEPTVAPEPPAQLNSDEHFAYVYGYPEGDVRPMNNITREEVASIFFRLLTDDYRSQILSQTNSFTDVDADSWSNEAISSMVNAGIISGYPDGTFKPHNNITRAEFAAIAARFDSNPYTGNDMFGDIAGHWAADSINKAAAKGWVSGDGNNTFRPNDNITRAEAITLINNVLNRHVLASGLLDDMATWTDNSDPNAWYYTAVQEATNAHLYERAEGETNETWTEIL